MNFEKKFCIRSRCILDGDLNTLEWIADTKTKEQYFKQSCASPQTVLYS